MNKKLLLVTGIAVASVSIYSTALIAATVSGTANANVLTPLSIVAGADMNFGDIAGDATAITTVDLDPSTGATSSGDGASVAGTTAAGVFTVTGSGTLSYTIDPIADTTLTGPGTAMTLTNLDDSLGGTGTLAAGTQNFTVGGTLTLNANQGVGAYSGTYSVTVNYQ